MKIITNFDYLINKKSILIRMGYNDNTIIDPFIDKLIDEMIEISNSFINPKLINNSFSIKVIEDIIQINNSFDIKSKSLSSHLKSCDKINIFFVTLSKSFDDALHKYSLDDDITKSYILNEIGSYVIEKIASIYNNNFKKDKAFTTTRFSPGYGDFFLSYQTLLSKLVTANKIGILVNNDSYLLTPIKSISAIIGYK